MKKIIYLYLVSAIIFEVIGTTLMKLSNGFSNLSYSATMIVFYLLSLISLSLALKNIEVGVAYAIWSGVGIALIATIGILFFQESLNIEKAAFIGLIIMGVVGINLTGIVH